MNTKQIRFLSLMGVFIAIELLFCFTTLGSLTIGPGVVATLSHIPVLIAALSLGMKAAVIMGAVFGVSSLIVWSTSFLASPVAFIFTPFGIGGNFWSLVICLLPRIVFAVLAVLLYKFLIKKKVRTAAALSVSAIAGAAIHTVLVLGIAFLAFHNKTVLGNTFFAFVIAPTFVNTLIEIALAAIVTTPVVLALQKLQNKKVSV